MAEQEIIIKRLEKCVIPVYSLCLYARMNRRPWRQLSNKNMEEVEDKARTVDVILVVHIKYPTLGLIDQMTGFLITKRYQYTTVNVDQALRLIYVYPQERAL